MTDYQIEPHTRRCAATGRDLQPGERFYTALLEEGEHFARKDYSSDGWQGPPPGSFSYWTGKVPPAEAAHKARFDPELLMDCFLRLDGQSDPARVNFRYVVGLLLMRRKRLRFEQAVTDGDIEKVSLRCTRTGARHEVINPRLGEEEMMQVQSEVFKVLGWQ
ncbi:MAG: hypothetical protein FJ271_26770 [Planctomycetes bacterium]|nr:hypothetical protein [Planctomycetota bacterium]